MSQTRCPYAIRFGITLKTRCSKPAGHIGWHEGRGLVQFSYQRVEWAPGDRREFLSERTDPFAWEERD